MAFRGSISRSIFSTARSSIRSNPSVNPRRSPPMSSPRFDRRGTSFAPLRTFGELGCAQSMLPLHDVITRPRLTAHISVSVRACVELSQGRSDKDG